MSPAGRLRQRLSLWGQGAFDRDANTTPPWLRWAALIALLSNFAVFGLAKVNLHHDPDELDTGRYLNAALSVREHGGAIALPVMLIGGVYRESVQQPLYHAALSPFAVRDIEFFCRAKLVSLLFGLLAVFACFRVGRACFGDAPALVAALMLCYSYAFIFHTTMVACESLLVLCTLLAWGFWVRWLHGERGAGMSGLCAGLAFLTKATSLLLLPAAALSAWACRKKREGALRGLVMWVALFAAVASPVLTRNTVVFGNPLYNPHSAMMWLDRWEATYRPDRDAQQPTALSYLRSHTPQQVLGRFGRGSAAVANRLARDALGVFGLSGRWRRVWGATVLALALFGMLIDPEPARSLFTAAMTVIFVAAFAWFYTITPASRFLLAFSPLLQLYAAVVLTGMIRSGLAALRLRRDRTSVVITSCVGLLCLGLLLGVNVHLRSLRANPLRVVRPAPGFGTLRRWLQDHLRPGEAYAHGPSHSYPFGWNSRPPLQAVALPLVRDLAELRAWLAKNRLRYLVVDHETVQRRRQALRQVVAKPGSRKAPLRVLRLPPGWRIATRGPAKSTRYVVFEIAPGGPT